LSKLASFTLPEVDNFNFLEFEGATKERAWETEENGPEPISNQGLWEWMVKCLGENKGIYSFDQEVFEPCILSTLDHRLSGVSCKKNGVQQFS